MKKVARSILMLVIICLLQAGVISEQHSGSAQSVYVAEELLVKFDPSSPQLASVAHLKLGATVVRDFAHINWQHVRLPKGMSVAEGLVEYRKLGVIAAQPNFIYRVAAVPNDPMYGELYAMNKIQAPVVWNTTTGSPNIVVAVIDTGIDYTHEDLNANMWRNPGEVPANGLDDDANGYVDDIYGIDVARNDSDPEDEYNHGTHVAGTIGAVGNNGVGIAGVNWSVRLMSVKLFDHTGESTSAMAVACFQYVTMMKNRGVNVRITNNSWGGPPEGEDDLALEDAIEAAGEAGILNVCAAGNQGRNIDPAPFYPASFSSPGIISVASSDSNDDRSGFSNYGVTSVDLAAPGSNILSTNIGVSSYGYKSGTSMAAPQVAGAGALLLANNPALSVAALKAALMNSVDVLPQWIGNVASHGRLNIARTLQNTTPCNFSLSSTSHFFAVTGGEESVNVTATNGCGWTAKSNADWITIQSATGTSGNGSVSYLVRDNFTGSPRAGTMTIAGHTFNVTQDSEISADCTYVISPQFQSLPAAGAGGTITVLAEERCAWQAVASVSWITITSNCCGIGNGTVSYTVAPNPSPAGRKGTITIAGRAFSVKQKGA